MPMRMMPAVKLSWGVLKAMPVKAAQAVGGRAPAARPMEAKLLPLLKEAVGVLAPDIYERVFWCGFRRRGGRRRSGTRAIGGGVTDPGSDAGERRHREVSAGP